MHAISLSQVIRGILLVFEFSSHPPGYFPGGVLREFSKTKVNGQSVWRFGLEKSASVTYVAFHGESVAFTSVRCLNLRCFCLPTDCAKTGFCGRSMAKLPWELSRNKSNAARPIATEFTDSGTSHFTVNWSRLQACVV